EKMTIVAAITNGDSDFLMVGRNGVFYDRKGRDWDATVTKIVEQPISVRQAFWSPYKRVARLVSAQTARFAGEKASASDEMLQTAVVTVPSGAGQPAAAPEAQAAPAAAPAPAFDIARFAGVFAAIGLALGAIGTAVAATVTGFLELEVWQMP